MIRATGFALIGMTVLIVTLTVSLCALSASRVSNAFRHTQIMVEHTNQRLNNNQIVDEFITTWQATDSIHDATRAAQTLAHDIDTKTITNTWINKPYKEIEVSIQTTKSNDSSDSTSISFTLLSMAMFETVPTQAVVHYPSTDRESLLQQYIAAHEKQIGRIRTLFIKFANAVNGCDQVDHNTRLLIHQDGTCDLSNLQIGTPDSPSIVWVDGADLNLFNTQIYGLVLHLCSPANQKTMHLNYASQVTGAVISNCISPQPQNQISFAYTMLSELQTSPVNTLHIAMPATLRG